MNTNHRKIWFIAIPVLLALFASALSLSPTLSVPSSPDVAHASVWQETAAPFAGEGTDESPYLLYDEADLALLSDLVASGAYRKGATEDALYSTLSYALAADIDATDLAFTPIGTADDTVDAYIDVTDFLDRENLVPEAWSTFSSLFYLRDASGVYHALSTLDPADYPAPDSYTYYHLYSFEKAFFGTFDGAGYAIANLTSENNASDAGVFGYAAYAEIKNLTLSSSVLSGAKDAGGIVGKARGCSLQNCVVTDSSVASSGADAAVGGVAGRVLPALTYTLPLEHNENMTTDYHRAVGDAYPNAYASFSVSDTTLSSLSYAGGIVGAGEAMTLTDAYSSCVFTGAASGAIVGSGTSSYVARCLYLTSPAVYAKTDLETQDLFYPSDVLTATEGLGLSTDDLLTDEFYAALSDNWTQTAGTAVLRYYPSPTSFHASFTAYEVRLDGEHFLFVYGEGVASVPFSLSVLPQAQADGYDLLGFTVGNVLYETSDALSLTTSVEAISTYELTPLSEGHFSVDTTASSVYTAAAQTFATVTYDASGLDATYLWYRSADGETYQATDNATNALTLTHVADSDYYRCLVTVFADDSVYRTGPSSRTILLAENRYSVRPYAVTLSATATLSEETSAVYTGSALAVTYSHALSAPMFAGDYQASDVTYSVARDGVPVGEIRTVGVYTIAPALSHPDYRITTTSATFTVLPATITYTASSYEGVYDGQAHGITLTDLSTADGSPVSATYSSDDVAYLSDPTLFLQTNVCSMRIYFRLTADNHETVRSHADLTITPRTIALEKKNDHPAWVKAYDAGLAFPVSDLTTAFYDTPLAGDFASCVQPVRAEANSVRVGAVTVTVTFSVTDPNLVLSQTTLVYDATIEQAVVTVTPLRTVAAVYNGTRLFTEALTSDCYRVDTDSGATPILRLLSAYADSKDATADNDVLHGVFALTGSFFRFAESDTVDFAFSLSPAPLSVDASCVYAEDRAYDGTTTVVVRATEEALSGAFGPDSPSLLFSAGLIASPDASETPYPVSLASVAVDDPNYFLYDGLAEDLGYSLTVTISKAHPDVRPVFGSETLFASASALPDLSLSGGTPGSVVWQYVVLENGAIDWSRYLTGEDVAAFRYDFTPTDDVNYETLSDYRSFTVIPVAPTSLSLDYSGPEDYAALSEFDVRFLTVSLVHNDGSSFPLPYGRYGYSLLYPSGGVVFSGTDDRIGVQYAQNNEYFYAEIPVVVHKITLLLPYAERRLTYNGQAQFLNPVNYRSALMTINGNVATAAGTYEATVAINDASYDDYVFSDGSSSATLSWGIDPLPKYEPFLAVASFSFTGEAIRPELRNDYNANDLFYTVSGDLSAVDAGEYVIRVSLVSDNFAWRNVEGDVVLRWSISPKVLRIPEIYDLPFTFDDQTHDVLLTADEGYSFSGDTQYRAVGSYAVTATLVSTQNYVWEDQTVDPIVLPYVVRPIRVIAPAFSATHFYTGSAFFVTIAGNEYYDVTGDLRAVNAGEYRVVVSLKDPLNHRWDDDTQDDRILRWEILPSPVKLPTVGGALGYTGTPQTALLLYDSTMCIARNDVATDVGDYEATISLRNPSNTYWADGTTADRTLRYSIVPRKIAIPAPPASVLYTGGEQTAAMETDPAYVIDGNVRTEAGSYAVTVRLVDKKNTCWEDDTTADKTYVWKICTLSVVTEDGEASALTSYALGGQLASPYRSGFFFDGWYLTPDFSGDAVTSVDAIDENTVLYAKWVEISSTEPIPIEKDEKESPLSQKAVIGIAVAGGAFVLAALILVFGFVLKRSGGNTKKLYKKHRDTLTGM